VPTLERPYSHLQYLTVAEADDVLDAHLEYDARRVRRISTRLNLALASARP
jgi:hypothetical protein